MKTPKNATSEFHVQAVDVIDKMKYALDDLTAYTATTKQKEFCNTFKHCIRILEIAIGQQE